MAPFYRLICSVFILLAATAGAQAQLQQQVMATGGATSNAITGYTIDFTLGEAIISTNNTGNAVFTQGFHQPPAAAGYPVLSVSLWAMPRENYIDLGWTTNAEADNNLFYIERSADSILFTTIGSIRSKAPGGFSNIPLQYLYADLQPLTGKNYYRLRQVSNQGKISYSEIVMAQLQHSTWGLHIYPNPVHDILRVKAYTDRNTVFTFRISNAAGQEVMTAREVAFSQGYNDYTMNLSFLPAGVYILHVVNGAPYGSRQIKLVKL